MLRTSRRLSASLVFVVVLVGFVFLLAQGASYAVSSDCEATLSSDLKLNIPVLSFEGNYYQLGFQYSPSSDGLIWFTLTDIAQTSQGGCGNPASLTLSSDKYIFYIPSLNISGTSYWLDFEYMPTTDGLIWVKLTNYSAAAIVGTWYKTTPDSNAAELLTFEPGGVVWYGVYQPNYPDDPAIGFQHGTYIWDPANGALVFTNRDANTAGDWGFPLETVTVTFQSANQISVHSNDGTFIMYRLTASPANPIVGTWQAFKINKTSGDKVANLINTPDGYYMLINLDGPDNVDGIPGLEYGTYTFNPSTGVFAVTPLADTSRHWGISPDSSQITCAIFGTTMKVGNGDDVTTLQRLEP